MAHGNHFRAQTRNTTHEKFCIKPSKKPVKPPATCFLTKIAFLQVVKIYTC